MEQTAMTMHDVVIRVAGFEPATTCTQNRYATKLRYTLNAYSGGLEPPTFNLEG